MQPSNSAGADAGHGEPSGAVTGPDRDAALDDGALGEQFGRGFGDAFELRFEGGLDQALPTLVEGVFAGRLGYSVRCRPTCQTLAVTDCDGATA